MLIKENSPFRRLPSNLLPKTAQFCDGMRYAAEMADFAYEQLVTHLKPLSNGPSENPIVSASPAFLFAWSIIDSVHRFRGLIENFSSIGKKNQSPEFRNFLDKAEAVETLRHAVQHMESEIRKSGEAGDAVWGTLSWVSQTARNTVYTQLLLAGAMMPGGKYTPVMPAGLKITAPLDHLTLRLGGVSVNLSELMKSLSRLVGVIENGLTDAFSDNEKFPETFGSDFFFALEMFPGPNGSMTIPAQDPNGPQTAAHRAFRQIK
jgi:hypothetical protein